jgi:lysozyme
VAKKGNGFTKLLKLGFILFAIFCGIFFLWHQYKLKTFNGFQQKIMKERASDFQIFGIDISHHQETIDWDELLIKNELDSIISFVYFKVSEGISHSDSRWEEHRDNLKKYHKKYGAYHFFLPEKDPKLQAENFLNHYSKTQSNLPPVLDVEIEEKNKGQLIKSMAIWLRDVELKTGEKPIIYTSLSLYKSRFHDCFKNYKFWVASYSKQPDLENDPRIICWQYSEKGKLPGINGNLDMNVMRSSFWKEIRRIKNKLKWKGLQ